MSIIFGYLLVLAAAVVVAIVFRARVLGPNRAPTVDPQAVPIEELALLAGGPPRAAIASALMLYEAGALTSGNPRAHFSAARPAPAGCHELSAAVHALVSRENQTSILRIRQSMADSPALHTTRERLTSAGLIPTPNHARRLRVLRRTLLVLAVGGVPVLLIAIFVEPIAAVLTPVVILSGFLTGGTAILATRTPQTTRMGRNLLAAARSRAAAFASGGIPGQRAIAFALFGPLAIWRADPTFAHQFGLISVSRRSGHSGGHDGGDWGGDSSGGGCGGGGGGDSGGGGGCGGGDSGGGGSCGGGGGSCGGGGGGGGGGGCGGGGGGGGCGGGG